jgi:molybdopterin synthase sulfur carrier subunit
MPTVFIPTPMRKVTGNKAVVTTTAGSVSSVFEELNVLFPGMAQQLCDADGVLKKYINVFVNGDEIKSLQGLNTALQDRDEVYIVPAMAGG